MSGTLTTEAVPVLDFQDEATIYFGQDGKTDYKQYELKGLNNYHQTFNAGNVYTFSGVKITTVIGHPKTGGPTTYVVDTSYTFKGEQVNQTGPDGNDNLIFTGTTSQKTAYLNPTYGAALAAKKAAEEAAS